ncbi:GNAT family N-acetyltransferase [Qipengyuania sp. 1NDH17]|uniref:GNAT family N-acetyltransferase n=1 Tax=Qipengyuania polymorpha TaxID=2867234 RepID=A0ABS7J123_9SPHN|nr:GNAT family N-acetyltransferase [Qipengyuania polymorpha]MBX7458265.1 GNAT family N-acetyltransferase [Qipengyuania polymorpha]
MSDFSIRLARAEDADALPAIELAAGKIFDGVEGLSGVSGMDAVSADEQRRLIRKGHSLVAEADGRIIGFLSTEPFRRELHIREFSVHPDHQGQGIGSVLLRAADIDARNSGFAALTLTTFVDVPWNGPFYARHGFKTVTDLDAHPRLKADIEQEVQHGLPRERRIAMIRFLD